VLEVKKFNIIIFTREYYNSVRKMITDKDQPQTINKLLMALQKKGFVYKIRVKIEENDDGVTIKKKMI
jgi:hypothetical protein